MVRYIVIGILVVLLAICSDIEDILFIEDRVKRR